MVEKFLKPSVKAEPLLWKWYAWSHLISPTTAACNLANRYLKIMQSYIQAPHIHAQAIKSPALMGGPFIDLNGEKAEEINSLLKEIQINCRDLLDLANSIQEFDSLLQSKAEGDTLEGYYKLIPDNLKGLIEIVYDLNNNSSIRFIEPLIYKMYYSDKYQGISLSDTEGDFRPFIMSTPRLLSNKEVYINVPFIDKKLDVLFSMREQPRDLKEIQEMLGISTGGIDLFSSFFTENSPELGMDNNYNGDEVRVRYFGHACVLLQTKCTSILIDPVISYEFPTNISRYTYKDLPDTIDYVLLTHNHQDHVLFETLLQLRYKIKNIIIPTNNKGSLADPSLKLVLKQLGFDSVIAIDEFEQVNVKDGSVIGLPFLGEHSDLNIQTKMAYYVNLQEKKIIFAADSNNLDPCLYKHIFNYIGKIDVLFIGMECEGAPLTWVYGPLLTTSLKRVFDNARTLCGSNFEKAWDLAQSSGCRQAYIYAMGQEPWLNYIMALNYNENSPQIKESNKFIEKCKENNIFSERLFIKKEWIL